MRFLSVRNISRCSVVKFYFPMRILRVFCGIVSWTSIESAIQFWKHRRASKEGSTETSKDYRDGFIETDDVTWVKYFLCNDVKLDARCSVTNLVNASDVNALVSHLYCNFAWERTSRAPNLAMRDRQIIYRSVWSRTTRFTFQNPKLSLCVSCRYSIFRYAFFAHVFHAVCSSDEHRECHSISQAL